MNILCGAVGVQQRCILCFSILFGLLGPIWAQNVEKSQESPFFLLPQPFADPLGAGKTSQDESQIMLQLQSAPVLNRTLWAEQAVVFERRVRQKMRQLQQQLRQRVCALPVAERSPALTALLGNLEEQWRLWHFNRDRYERSLFFNFRASLSAQQLVRVRERYVAVHDLREERQRLVLDAHRRFLGDFRRGLGTQSNFCDGNLKIFGGYLPTERLFAPLYLALYRFLESLPLGERVDFVLPD